MHYENKEPCSKLKDVNELNESRIREAKEKREKLFGENFHEKQCLSVPDAINNDTWSSYRPLLQKIHINFSKKQQQEDEPITTRRSSKRTSLDETATPETAWMFQEQCYFCKSKRVQYKGKKGFPMSDYIL